MHQAQRVVWLAAKEAILRKTLVWNVQHFVYVQNKENDIEMFSVLLPCYKSQYLFEKSRWFKPEISKEPRSRVDHLPEL